MKINEDEEIQEDDKEKDEGKVSSRTKSMKIIEE